MGAGAYGIGADGLGNLYIAGGANKAATRKTVLSHRVVRKSTDGGASFTTVDDITPTGTGGITYATLSAATSSGDVYVAGSIDGQNFLRKSAGGTGAWTTVDAVPFQSRSIAANASGNLFLGGNAEFMVKKY